jgi:hypothetical protein
MKLRRADPAISLPPTQWRTTMTIPHYINEDRSDMRAIKPGWYAMDGDGSLCSGPFSSREVCLTRINQPSNGSTPSM